MTTSSVDGVDKFKLEIVHSGFQACLINDEDIDMDNYLIAYKELYKFFQLMGSVFGFVGSDVKNKIEILEDLRNGIEQDHFSTLKTMVKHEIEFGLLKKPNHISGCRTFLRLHRGLDFIKLFLGRVGELKGSDKTTTVCQDAYNETLSKYHPWLVRKGALMAMYTLPTRDGLLQKVCGSSEEVEKALDTLPKMLDVAQEAYNRTDNTYTENNLHDLP